MSSLALMRWLEGAPSRYDAGMRLLTLGRAARCQDALARAAVEKPEARILEIGCGTGALTVRLVARGATVRAVDQNPEMLEQARARLAAEPPERAARVEWVERSAAEIDGLPAAGFFEDDAGRRIEPDVIRRFKLNLLGTRTISAESVREAPPPDS